MSDHAIEVIKLVNQAFFVVAVTLIVLGFMAFVQTQMFDWRVFWHFNSPDEDDDEEEEDEE